MQKPADQFQELGGECISKIPNKDKIQDLKASGSEESRLCYVELEFLHRKSSRGDPELELLVRIFINNLQKVFKYIMSWISGVCLKSRVRCSLL